jgi:hypothetical protein
MEPLRRTLPAERIEGIAAGRAAMLNRIQKRFTKCVE